MSKKKSKTLVVTHEDAIYRQHHDDKEPKWYVRTSYVQSDDEGYCTFQVRPWCGSIEIRFNDKTINVDTLAVPELIRLLELAHKEAQQ